VGAFGEKLRKQREQRGIALDAISNTTKISTRMLRAIEEEHFDQLPGGVFNKGFIRAYARQVGLNEEEAVTDYLTALRESQIAAQTVPPNFRAHPGKPSTGPDPGNREPGRTNAPGYDVLKSEVPKTDFLKNDFRKNDVRKNDLRKEDIPRNDIGHDLRPAESTRNKNNKSIPRRSADRRREDRREGRREDGRNRARSVENPQARAPHAPDQHPQPVFSEPVISPHAGNSVARVPWGKLAAVLLLLTLTLALWSHHRRGQATPAAQTAGQTAAQTATKTAPSLLPSTASSSTPIQVPIQFAASSTPLTTGKALSAGTLVTADAPSSNTAPTLADAATQPSPAPSSKPSTSKPAAGSSASTDNPPAAQSAAHSSAAKVPPTFSLLIRATETSSVSVVADGQPLLKETLIAPAQTSVRATREIVVHTGNAAGISFLLNGKEIPLSGAEGEGEAKTYTFDATGLQTSTAAQPSDSAH
jgi:hypothetical protein